MAGIWLLPWLLSLSLSPRAEPLLFVPLEELLEPVQEAARSSRDPQKPVSSGEVSLPMVHLYARVVDNEKHFLTDLKLENFELFEEGESQTIVQFSREQVPVRVGILVDVSKSMRSYAGAFRTSLKEFAQTTRELDEIFVMTFDESVNPPPANDPEHIFASKEQTPDLLEAVEDIGMGSFRSASARDKLHNRNDSRGDTNLYGAILTVLECLQESKRAKEEWGCASRQIPEELKKKKVDPILKKQRRVIFLITDGYDNEKRNTLAKVLEKVQRADVAVYALLIQGPYSTEGMRAQGKRIIGTLVEETGGSFYESETMEEIYQLRREASRTLRSTEGQQDELADTKLPAELTGLVLRIAEEMRTQYYLAFTPFISAPENICRKVRIKLVGRSGLAPVKSRSCYYTKPVAE